MADGGGGGMGPRPWHQDLDPTLRPRVLDKIVNKLADHYHGQHASLEDLNRLAARYENKVFNEANTKEDYLWIISNKLVNLDQTRQPVPQAASGLQQHIQMGCNVQPVNAVQAIHGGNSSITAMSQVASTMSSHGRRSSQLQTLTMTPPASGLVSNQHIKVKQEQPQATGMSGQILNCRPASVTPLAPGVQPSQRMVQSIAAQNQKQLPAMRMQPTNFAGCNPTSITQNQKQLPAMRMEPTKFSGCNPTGIAQKGQPVVQPNGQQNHLLGQNARGTSMLPQEQMMTNQQGLVSKQQQMDRQRYQMLVTQDANVTKKHNGHPGGGNSQQNSGLSVGLQSPLKKYKQEALKKIKMEPMALPQQLITVSQQNSLLCTIPQNLATMGSAGEVDWREEMFQQIKQLKDAYLLELMELDQVILVPKITKKQFESLPKDKAEQYRYKAQLKQKTKTMQNFLQLQKSNIPENLRGQLPMFVKSIQDLLGPYRKSKDRKAQMDAGIKSQISCGQLQIINLSGDLAASNGIASSHQKQQEQPVDSQLSQNVVTTTPAASQQNNSNLLLGVASSFFPEKSPGSLQSLPTNKLQECCMQSPFTKSGVVKVSSPSASLKSISSSPVAKLAAVNVAVSPSVLVKSTLPSPVARTRVVKVASPSALVNSTLTSPFAKSGVIQAASTSASGKSTLPSKSGVIQAASTSASGKSTLPSKSGVIQAASPHASVKSTLPSPVINSGVVPVASPCASVNPMSPENFESVSALLLQDNSAAPAAQTAIGGAAIAVANGSKSVTPTKPIMLASPLQEETAKNPEEDHDPATPLQAETADRPAEDHQHGGAETPVAKKPIDRLIDAVRTSSPAMLCSSANSICSVFSMNDQVPHREIDAFQDWAFFSQQGGSSTVNKMKHIFESTSSCSESPPLGSVDGSCVTLDCNALEAESNLESGAKRQKTQNAKDALLDEISSANSVLLDTVISIADDNVTDGIASRTGGALIKLSYTAMSLTPDLKSLFAASGMSIVMPVKILVPADYPRSSPVLVCDQGDEQLRKKFQDISGAADVAFRHALYRLQEPMSVGEMARVWDACVRRVVVEYAQQLGGGTFSSRYGWWERC